MFEIERIEHRHIRMIGRLDASEAEKASALLAELTEATVVDLGRLDYISSVGLGLLLKTQKRLQRTGSGLRLVRVGKHLNDIFRYSGFHHAFEIEVDS